jgi:MFS superfamily sulfate permease-like transporter
MMVLTPPSSDDRLRAAGRRACHRSASSGNPSPVPNWRWWFRTAAGKLRDGDRTLTALVGVIPGLARLMRLGFVADFISAPVLTGFKAGIGLVIVLDQVPKLLGTHITKQGFFPDLLSVAQHIPEASLLTLAVAVAPLVILVSMDRLWPHSPAPLVAVGAGIARRGTHSALGVSAVGHIPRGLPSILPLAISRSQCGSHRRRPG